MPASMTDVVSAINATAGRHGYSCVPVSWEDAQRGHNSDGGLSVYGPNIADVRLYEKNGRLLYTLRSQNWNERVGYIASKDITLVTGNESGSTVQGSTTLADYLQSIGTYGTYVGLRRNLSLFSRHLDELFTIRFQAVFLPVDAGKRATTEFCTEVYSYQTASDDDPRNLLLLATPQGTSIQQDTAGAGKVFFHSKDPLSGQVGRFWLEAEQSDFGVGGAQTETIAEAAQAAQRGKAVATRIGPAALGNRFNVQMLIQVPLKQQESMQRSKLQAACFDGADEKKAASGSLSDMIVYEMAPPSPTMEHCRAAKRDAATVPVGESNAARISRGSLFDYFKGLCNLSPKRDTSQHGTITVTSYYTVQGGVPSVNDVERCIKDIDTLYAAMPVDKRLVDAHEVTSSSTQHFPIPVPKFIQAYLDKKE